MAHFLLIHGACHGGWCWDSVVGLLAARGHQATAPDLPCEDVDAGLDDYAEAAIKALGAPPADLVVVAHSLGGLVAPLVATRLPTRRMVMLAGIIGAPGKSLEQLGDVDADRDGPLGEGDLEVDGAGRFRFTAAGARRVLFHDCSQEEAERATAKLRFQVSMWTQVADFDEWPDVETASIVCTEDRVVNPTWSDRVARERLGVEPIHLRTGHEPFVSRPAGLVDLLTRDLQ
jgi:pimeloyl-ACP methyl ester carboxylesterase